MFKNIGGKIKGIAIISAIICMIPSVILGLYLMSLSEISEPMGVLGLIVIILGVLFPWIGFYLLYGYGQLVENSDKLVLILGGKEKPQTYNPAFTEDQNQKILRITELRKKGLITEEQYQKAINSPNILDKF